MGITVTINPGLLSWARERASLSQAELAVKVGSKARPAPIHDWEITGQLPIKKLELIASKTNTPLGYLFLSEPPNEPLPIQDFRRGPGATTPRASTELLDTVYACQYRQAWMSSRLKAEGATALQFVNSANLKSDPQSVAQEISSTCKIGFEERTRSSRTYTAVLAMIAGFEDAGILVQRSGIAGNNTKRRLEYEEFKGFALSDAFAPLIFINGNDWPASQAFTLVHEAVHLWLGESAIPDGDWEAESHNPTERFCNVVAAEVLVPAERLRADWKSGGDARGIARQLAQTYKVSVPVILIKARTINLISSAALSAALQIEKSSAVAQSARKPSSGGDYYSSAGTRLGKRFIREVLVSTLEGKTLFTEAFELLGTNKTSVFNGLARKFLQGRGQ